MPHIEVRDVSLTYDTPGGRVAGVAAASFAIEQSEFLCIVGPSGCGKSTLLNLIAGFLTPTGGEIRIGGRRVDGHGLDREARRLHARHTPARRVVGERDVADLDMGHQRSRVFRYH